MGGERKIIKFVVNVAQPLSHWTFVCEDSAAEEELRGR